MSARPPSLRRHALDARLAGSCRHAETSITQGQQTLTRRRRWRQKDVFTKEKVERFRSHFPQFSVLKMAGDLAQVVTVDQLSETVEPMPKGEEVNAKAKITVAISHAPLITPLQR